MLTVLWIGFEVQTELLKCTLEVCLCVPVCVCVPLPGCVIAVETGERSDWRRRLYNFGQITAITRLPPLPVFMPPLHEKRGSSRPPHPPLQTHTPADGGNFTHSRVRTGRSGGAMQASGRGRRSTSRWEEIMADWSARGQEVCTLTFIHQLLQSHHFGWKWLTTGLNQKPNKTF